MPPAATPEKAYDFMNVRYGIAIDSLAGTMGLAERPSAFPHARILYDARLATAEEAQRLLKSGEVDFTKTVLLEHAPGSASTSLPALQGAGTGTATITRYEADEIEVTTTSDRPGILVLSEVWYPAWKAYIDGAESEVMIADYSLRGVAIPAGSHTVTMRYESATFATGMWITLLTLAATIAGIVVVWSRGRQATIEAGSEQEGARQENPVVAKEE